MTDIRKYTSTLSMPEKVELFNNLYGELAGYGTEGDTELAHVNTFEARLLKSIGGSGTINEITGLRQFGGGGQPPPPPQQQVKQEASFPKELRPFVSDALTQGQAEFEREQAEGFQPFPGPQIAEFGPEQLAAQELGRRQFTGLAGTPLAQASTYYQPALSATALGTAEIGTEDIQRRMDPFLQNVVDIAKREAVRDEDLASQGRAAQAVGAGSFGGSRQAILEAEAERNLGQRLGDIQAQGLSTAFQNAQLAAEQQRQREMTGGRQFAALGDITGTRARSDLSGLAGIGEIQQQREQQALDLARREFLEEQAFPQRSLQRYASLIRGFPLDASQQRTTIDTLATPSLAQTLVGGLGTAAGLYGAFGGFKKEGGLVGLQGGGQPMMDQQQPNELDSLEMLRQRGAAIRGLSEPVGSGGVVNRFGGSRVSATKTAQPQGGPATSGQGKGLINMILRNNPKFLEKLKGLGGTAKKAYAEFNPGTQGGQYAEGGLLSVSKNASTSSLNNPDDWLTQGHGGSQNPVERSGRVPYPFEEYERLRKLVEEGRIGRDDPLRTEYAAAQEAYLEGVKGRSGKLEDRLAGLADRERQAQFGNLAKFLSRLGTDVSGGAQQGGLRGLLGATVSAGEQTLPSILQTQEDFYGKELDLLDQIEQSDLAALETKAGISKEALEQERAYRAEEQAAAGTLFDLSTDLYGVQADIRVAELAALGEGASSSDVNSLKNLIYDGFKVDYQVLPNGDVVLGDDVPPVVRLKILNAVEKGLEAMRLSGPDVGGIQAGLNAVSQDIRTHLGEGTISADRGAIDLLRSEPDEASIAAFIKQYGGTREQIDELISMSIEELNEKYSKTN